MRLLVVDAVKWSAEHERQAYPKDVGRWIIDGVGENPGLEVEWTIWRAQNEPAPPAGPFDGVIISGSASSAYDCDAWIARLADAIRGWASSETPMLGICFGHQLIAHALGGRVIRNPAGWEVGTQTVEITGEGRADPILRGLPRNLNVMESHQDIVAEPPPGARVLAANGKSDCQSFAIGDTIRTVQFHPEYTVDHIRFLLGPRRKMLEACGVDLESTLSGLKPTPEAQNVLSNFITGIVQTRSAEARRCSTR